MYKYVLLKQNQFETSGFPCKVNIMVTQTLANAFAINFYSSTLMHSILTDSSLLAVVYSTGTTYVTVFIANVPIYVLTRFYNAASFAQCCGFSNGMQTIR